MTFKLRFLSERLNYFRFIVIKFTEHKIVDFKEISFVIIVT